MIGRFIPLVLAVALVAGGCADGAWSPRTSRHAELASGFPAESRFTRKIDARILFYSEQTARYPRSWPVYVQLASAHLAKARLTQGSVWLDKCSAALAASMSIQPNFEAFKLKARALQHGHRFEEAIAWVRRAQEVVSPASDPEVTALLVSSYIGLGRYGDAERILPPPGSRAGDSHTAGALGLWLASQRRWDEAVTAYSEAARLARSSRSNERAAWAEVSAAAAFIDSKRFEEARPHLESARRLAPESFEVRLHSAELLEGQGHAERALAIYGELARELSNPSIHHMAFRTARALGLDAEASRHFRAAETGYRAVLDAGEVYSLEALARLYADGEVHLERARELAERNLDYKRDADARATLRYVLAIHTVGQL